MAPEAFVEAAISQAELSFEAEFGEGYWIDHRFYNLDLLDAYLSVYPDCKDTLLFSATVPYYQSPAFVQPRTRKSVLVEDGRESTPSIKVRRTDVRQYGAVVEDEESVQLIASHATARHLTRAEHGRGEVFRTTVFSKLLGLALVKFATLDPLGMGIEMEAGKPGWCDALNGLPGLFGSSLSETYELLRLLDLLLAALGEKDGGAVEFPVELTDLLRKWSRELTAYQAAFDSERDFRYWDAVASVREAYRARVRLGFDGRMETIDLSTLAPTLRAFREKVAVGIAKAEDLTAGLPPTYFTYTAQDYETLVDAAGQPLRDGHDRPYVRVKRFEQSVLPHFLEGPMHALKTRKDAAGARTLYHRVRESALYDRKLGMYKTNAPLHSCSYEIGRARAFTPGWLENESIFLHMAYKYLLEILRRGALRRVLCRHAPRPGAIP